jgi:hypothetical protein
MGVLRLHLALGLRAAAERIVRAEGFAINRSKTRSSRRSSRQVVTAVVVNDVVGLSRQERRRLRAAIHDLRREPDPVRREKLEAAVRGKIPYLHMLNPEQAGKLACAEAKMVNQSFQADRGRLESLTCFTHRAAGDAAISHHQQSAERNLLFAKLRIWLSARPVEEPPRGRRTYDDASNQSRDGPALFPVTAPLVTPG